MGFGLALRRPAVFALVIAGFISFTTTGKLSVRMLLDALVCWSFVPLMNLALVAVVARRFSRQPWPVAVDGYLAGLVPWIAWLLAVAGHAVWLPPGADEVWSLLPSTTALVGLAIAFGWSSWIQYRCLTRSWQMRPAPAALLLAAMKLAIWGAILLFFFASDQLEPRMGWVVGG